MRNAGLKNRFNQEDVNSFWCGWYTDLISGKNNADCLHHIKSPSSSDYKDGEFNKSVLNTCPLNNFETHIGNGKIHLRETETMLMAKVLKIAYDKVGRGEYQFTKNDCEFIKEYKNNYI